MATGDAGRSTAAVVFLRDVRVACQSGVNQVVRYAGQHRQLQDGVGRSSIEKISAVHWYNGKLLHGSSSTNEVHNIRHEVQSHHVQRFTATLTRPVKQNKRPNDRLQ